jgi:hypothetical protein
MIRLRCTILATMISACSGASFKANDDSKEKSQSNQKSSSEHGESSSSTKGTRAVPPEEVTGSYLACDVFDSGPGEPASNANIGCNAFTSNGTKLNLTDASTKWTLNDSRKLPATSKVITTSVADRFQMAWAVSYSILVGGFEASLELNSGLSAPIVIINQDHTFDRFSKLLSDGRSFSVAANLPSIGIDPYSLKDSTLNIHSIESPVQVTNYSVAVIGLDSLSGFCSGFLAPVNLKLKSSKAGEDIFDMTSSFWGTNSYFCLEIRGTFTVRGKKETAIVYQR